MLCFYSFSKAQIIKNTVEMGLKRLKSTAVEERLKSFQLRGAVKIHVEFNCFNRSSFCLI